MPRFVLLRHECPPEFGTPSHWDLMLELEGALATWRLLELPAAWSNERANKAPQSEIVPAQRLADHRLAYLEYEGPVSGNRGSVSQFDSGECRVLDETPGQLNVELHGKRVAGHVVFRHLAGEQWRLEIGA